MKLIPRLAAAALLPLALSWICSWSAYAADAPSAAQTEAKPDSAGGASGSVSSSGAFSVNIPLELPAARGENMPTGLSIAYVGGTRLSSVGTGWALQQSMIRRHFTRANKPGPDIVELNLLGQEYYLFPIAGTTSGHVQYRPLLASRNLVIDERPNDWQVRDESGHLYTFEQEPYDLSLWRLRSVSDADGNQMIFDYTTFNEAPTYGAGLAAPAAPETVLSKIRYSFLPGAAGAAPTCPKYTIDLQYARARDVVDGAMGYAVGVDNGQIRMHQRLLTEVAVYVATDCSSQARLRTYLFSYAAARETGLPRLARVDQLGLGQVHPSQAKPLVNYQYANLIGTDNVLKFGYGGSLSLPSGLSGGLFLGRAEAGVTMQELGDLSGDGLPDLVVRNELSNSGKDKYETWLYRALPKSWGSLAPVLGSVPGERLTTVAGANVNPPTPEEDVGVYRVVRPDGMPLIDGYRYDAKARYLDWNGDGRRDIVSSAQEGLSPNDGKARQWTIYLNQPSASGSTIAWKKVVVDVTAIYTDLKATMLVSAVASDVAGNVALCQQQCSMACDGDTACQGKCGPQCLNVGPNAFVLVNPTGQMPLGRTSKVTHTGTCKAYVKKDGQYVLEKTECPATEWLTEWKLQDVNGDSYPDLVRNALAATPQQATCNACPATNKDPAILAPECRSGCTEGVVDDLPTDKTRMLVYYHPGPALSVDGAVWNTKAQILYDYQGGGEAARSFGRACGLERVRRIGATEKTYAACQLQDVDGDGLADYLTESAEPYRGLVSPARKYIALRGSGMAGNGLAASFAASTALLVPGPVNVQSSGMLYCPNDKKIGREQLSGLVDVNADGRPDYVYYGFHDRLDGGQVLSDPESAAQNTLAPTPFVPGWNTIKSQPIAAPPVVVTTSKWFVRFNNGAAFGPSVPIEVPAPAQFALQRTVQRCEAIGGPWPQYTENQFAELVAGLSDVDGDGSPDLVNQENGALTYWSLRDDQPFQLGIAQVPAPGRLVALQNAQLGTFHLAYGSAKAYQPLARSEIPAAEVVVAKTWRTFDKNLAQAAYEEPTYYYFGSGRLDFDPVWRRYAPGGYRMSVESRFGDSASQGLVRWRAPSLDSQSLGAYAFRGTITSTGLFEAVASPWALLDLGPKGIGSLAALRSVDTSMPGLVKTVQLAEIAEPPGGFALTVYQASSQAWRGSAPPVDASSSTATQRWEQRQVDGCGRIVAVTNYGDIARTDDDVCTTTEFSRACEAGVVKLGELRRMDLPLKVTTHICGTSQALAQAGFVYSEKGHPLHVSTVVYDLETGAKLSEYTSEARQYDDVGNLVTTGRAMALSGWFGLWRMTKLEDFDPWRLTAGKTTVGAPGAPGLSERRTYDPVTMQVTSVTDANGHTRKTAYDAYGRPTTQSIVDAATGQEYLLSTIEYLGEDPAQASEWALGRRVRTTSVQSWVKSLADAAPGDITRSTVYFDEIGRTRYSESDLGADYGGAKTVSGYVEWDKLGRKKFEADPFIAGEALAELYGTTNKYFADNTVRCTIRSERKRAMELGFPEYEVMPTCVERIYANKALVTRTRGPAELTAGSPGYGAYDETVSTAIGKIVSAARFVGGVRKSYEEFSFDRLGNQTRIARSVTPESGGTMTEWTFAYDSQGHVRRRSEPGTATVAHEYDLEGRQTRASWTNSSGQLEEVRQVYDVMGRRAEIAGYVAGVVKSQVKYGYDTAAADPRHAFGTNLSGALAYSTTQDGEAVFYSYDRLGAVDTRAWTQGTADPELVFERWQRGPGGRIEELSLQRPGGPALGVESALYTYDSAGRPRSVDWATAVGAENLWTATKVSPRGQVEREEHGNGVVTETHYAPTLQRRFVDQVLSYAIPPQALATSTVKVSAYDNAGRKKGIKETRSEWGSAAVDTLYDYDALNHLVRERRLSSGTATADSSFSFDGLGNLVTRRNNLTTLETRFGMSPTSPEQVCSVQNVVTGTPTGPGPAALVSKGPGPIILPAPIPLCSYQYDATGRLVNEWSGALGAVPGGALRSLKYDPLGRPTEISASGQVATISYGAGGVSRLKITGPSGQVVRDDVRFGGEVERSLMDGQVAWEYRIPGAPGASVRFLSAGPRVVHTHGDGAYNMQVSGPDGKLSQRTSFDAWGKPTNEKGAAGSSGYVKYQWHGADTLDGMGVLHMGARLYDPGLGRFLQRDPLIIPRKADEVNPYEYAHGDPINKADPSGMDPYFIGYIMGRPPPGCAPPLCPWATGQSGDRESMIRAALSAEHIADSVIDALVKNPAVQFAAGGIDGATDAAFRMLRAAAHPVETAKNIAKGVATTYNEAGGGVSGVAAVVESATPIAFLRAVHEELEARNYYGAGYAIGGQVPGLALAAVGGVLGAAGREAAAVGTAERGLAGAAGGGGEMVSLYRAVGDAELGVIRSTGRIPESLSGLEVKYFSATPEGAASYARQAVRGFGDAPYTLVETQVPRSALPADVLLQVDRNVPAVVLPNTHLPLLGPANVWPFMPVP